ncbi:hypothetical protein ACI6PO_00515 [Agrobacterium tumefaciens]
MALFDFMKSNPNVPIGNSERMLSVGLGLLSGKTPQEQIAQAGTNFVNDGRLNRTTEYLRRVSPELAEAVANKAISPGDAYKLFAQQKLEAQKPRNNFMAVGKNLYDTSNGQWISPPAGAGGDDQEYGLNPQYGTDENGNPVIIQLSKGGTSRRTALPDGVTLSKEPIRIDAGTHTVLLDPITRQPIGQVSKNLSTAAEETAGGKALAENKAALPKVEEAANNMLSTIDSLSNDPYLDSMVGSVQGKWLPNMSSDAARVQSKMDQIGGQSFLQAYNALRGGGQITEVEGRKATEAMARLNTAQTEKDYREALAELRGIVATGVSRARAAAQGSNPAPAQTSTGGTPIGTNYKYRYGLE